MRRMLLPISFLCLLLSATKCQKKDECHESFFLKNDSQENVIIALRSEEGLTGLCRLEGESYSSGQSFELDLFRSCWEEELSGGRRQDVYIVDPSNYNDPSEFYPCDSIEVRNTVLRKYELTLEDLQATNFTMSYP